MLSCETDRPTQRVRLRRFRPGSALRENELETIEAAIFNSGGTPMTARPVLFFFPPRILIVLVAVAWSMAVVEAAERPPNIIYILADDLGYAELGVRLDYAVSSP